MRTAVGRPRQYGRMVAVAYFLAGALAAAMIAGAPMIPFSGSTFGIEAAVALALAPVAIALAIERPIIFPYALWAALVPFDNLLVLPGIGKIAKPLGAAAALAAIVSMLVRRRALIPSAAVGGWVLLAAFATASQWWSEDTALGTLMLQMLGGLLAVGAIIAMVPADETDLIALFCGVVGGGTAASIFAIMVHSATGQWIYINSIDHNHFGAALILPALAATAAAISLREPVRVTLCALAAAICVAGIGITESRGALISFGFGVAYLIVRSPHRKRLIGAVLAGVAMLALIPGVFARFNDPTTGDASGRYQIWHIGFAAFKHRWFAGHGFGSFLSAYQSSFLEYSQSVATAQRIQQSHNILVQFGVELGLVGLALLLLAWWWQFRALRRIGLHEGGWTDARFAIEANTIALFVAAMSLDFVTFKYTWLSMSAAWIVHAAYRSRTVRAPEARLDEPVPHPHPLGFSRFSLRNRRRGFASTATNSRPSYPGARIP